MTRNWKIVVRFFDAGEQKMDEFFVTTNTKGTNRQIMERLTARAFRSYKETPGSPMCEMDSAYHVGVYKQ